MAVTVFEWPEKAPTDVDPYGFDVEAWLEGETVDAVTWAIEVDGDDADDPGLGGMLGTAAVDGSIVKVLISAGLEGLDYLVSARVETSGGRFRTFYARLPVRLPLDVD